MKFPRSLPSALPAKAQRKAGFGRLSPTGLFEVMNYEHQA